MGETYGETYEEFVKRTGCDPEAVYRQAKKADAWAEEQEDKMSKDYDGDYAGVVLQVMETKPPLNDVVNYLDRQQRYVIKVRKENEELQNENRRLHNEKDKVYGWWREECKLNKPDAPLMSRDLLMLAQEVLRDAGVYDEWEDQLYDLRHRIKQVTQHEQSDSV